jgi:hypothetical protein
VVKEIEFVNENMNAIIDVKYFLVWEVPKIVEAYFGIEIS